MKKKLQLTAVFTQACQLLAQHYKLLLKFSIPYILLNVSGVLIPDKIIYTLYHYNLHKVFYYVLLIPSIYFLVLAFVGSVRAFILGAEEVKSMKVFRLSEREFKVMMYFIILIFIYFLMSLLPNLSYYLVDRGHGLWVLGFHVFMLFMAFYIPTRLSLILVTQSIEASQLNMIDVWSLSKGNSLKLFVLVGLIPFILFAFSSIAYLSRLIGHGFFEFNGLWFFILKELMSFVYLIYSAAVVSLFYQRLTSTEEKINEYYSSIVKK